MYAIVKTGGKQYRVERGQSLLVERLPAEEGASITLEPILYRSDEIVLDKAGLEKVRVTARIVSHERGQKLRVFKFKPKRGYKRRTGHRQDLTRIEVTELEIGGSRAKAAPAKAGKAAPAKAEKAAPKAEAAAPKAKAEVKAAAPKAKAKAAKADTPEAQESEARASAVKEPAAPKAKAVAKAKAKDATAKPRATKAKAPDDEKAAKPKAEEE